jgi:hypothetical protein
MLCKVHCYTTNKDLHINPKQVSYIEPFGSRKLIHMTCGKILLIDNIDYSYLEKML